MHSTNGELGIQRFLPWHRLYLMVLEQAIRAIPNYSNFFIPYSDWTIDRSIPNWLENFKPHVEIPDVETIPPPATSYNPVDVYRTPGQQGGFLPTKGDEGYCLEIPKYTDFTLELEGLHNGVHAWVGGTMTDIMTSPADPLFWMHHANIDRIYTLWQKNHPDSPDTIPNLSDAGQVMDPWSGTELRIRHSAWADWNLYIWEH